MFEGSYEDIDYNSQHQIAVVKEGIRVSAYDVKRRTWDALVSGSVTNAQARMMGGSFWQRGQQAITGPYLERYLSAVPGWWQDLSPTLARFLTQFLFPATEVRAEDGCIEYNIAMDAEGMGGFQTKFGNDTFVFVEKWRDAQALKAHAAAPHMAAYAAKVKDLIASRVIHVLSPAE